MDADMSESVDNDNVNNESPDVTNKGGKNNFPVCYSFDVSEQLVGPVSSKVQYKDGFIIQCY